MAKTTIVFDSLTGNNQHFIDRMKQTKPDWDYLKISDDLKLDQPFHLITFTTGLGEVPVSTANFLEKHAQHMLSVSSSGNRNWGPNYALAADKISQQYDKPILEKFEVADYQNSIDDIINKIKGRQYEK